MADESGAAPTMAPLESSIAELHGRTLPTDEHVRVSLSDALRLSAATASGVWTVDSAGCAAHISYRDLLQKSAGLASSLVPVGALSTDVVFIQLSHSRDIIPTAWAAWLLGRPVFIVPNFEDGSRRQARLLSLIGQFQSAMVIRASRADRAGGAEGTPYGALNTVYLDELRRTVGFEVENSLSTDVAVYLASSGTTGTPKIVPQTHQAIIDRCRAAQLFNGFSESDVSLNWLPLDHVGGLVMSHIQDVVVGCSQVQCDTRYVLEKPIRWMELCDMYKATRTWAPNFAYKIVAQKARTRARARLDLSRLSFLLNGGEPISPQAVFDFIDALKGDGLQPYSMRPAWGMSETCSGVTYSSTFEKTQPFAKHVSVGFPIPGVSVRIVDDYGTILRRGSVGRLWVKGAPVLSKYHQDQNSDRFGRDGWFDTGDLGLIDVDGLHIVARRGDVFIQHGVKISFREIEQFVESLPGVLPAFSCALELPTDGSPGLAIMLVPDPEPEDRGALALGIRRSLIAEFSVAADKIFLLTIDQVPLTSIGKVDRSGVNALLAADSVRNAIDVGDGVHQGREDTSDRTPLEQTVRSIFSELMGKDFDLDANLTEMGVNSVSLVEAQVRLSERFSIAISTVDLMDCLTGRDLCRLIVRHGGN